MAAMSNYLENKLVDHVFRGVIFTPPNAMFVALFTSAPSDPGGGTEVSAAGYGRVNLAPTTNNWAATDAVGSTNATSGGTSGTTSNNAQIAFGAPAANWGVITHFGVFDASTGGNLLWWGALDIPKTVNNGDAAPAFPAGALSFQIDN